MDIQFYEDVEHLAQSISKDKDGEKVIEKLNGLFQGDKINLSFGILVLNLVLEKCENEVFEENVRSWMRILMQTINSIPSEDLLKLCFICLMKLLETGSRLDKVSREIATKGIDPLLALLMSSSFSESVEKMLLFRCCLINYPGPCGQYRSAIQKLVISALESDDKYLCFAAAELFPLLTTCGSGGENKSRFVDNWTEQFHTFLTSGYYYAAKLQSSIDGSLDEKLGNEHKDFKLAAFSDIAEKLDIGISIISLRIERILMILENFLSTPMSFKVPVPFMRLIDFFCEVSNLLHIETSNIKHINVSIYFLKIIQALLKCITICIMQFSTLLLPFCLPLCKILKSIFTLSYSRDRKELYRCVISMIDKWKALPTYLEFHHTILDFIFSDIKLSDKLESGCAEKVVNKDKHVDKAKTLKEDIEKRKPEISGLSLNSHESIFEGLKLLEKIILHGAILSKRDFSSIVGSIRNIIMKLLGKHNFPSPYDVADNRLMIYKCCYGLLTLHHNSVQIPVSCILYFFKHGTTESHDSIRCFCHEVSLKYDCIMHPKNSGFFEQTLPDSSDLKGDDYDKKNFQSSEDSGGSNHNTVRSPSGPLKRKPTVSIGDDSSCLPSSSPQKLSRSSSANQVSNEKITSLVKRPNSEPAIAFHNSSSREISSCNTVSRDCKMDTTDSVLISDSSEEECAVEGVENARPMLKKVEVENLNSKDNDKNEDEDVEIILDMFCEIEPDE